MKFAELSDKLDFTSTIWFAGGFSSLDFNTVPAEHSHLSLPAPSQSKDLLSSIFENILRAVPKKRRTLEKRMTRRMQLAGHYEDAVPRNDLVVDQVTGHWKEKGTICRKF